MTASVSPATGTHDDVVQLVVPADLTYLAVLRTAAAGLAARLQFTLDEIEDLRIAVDEACTMLLPLAQSSAINNGRPGPPELRCRFVLGAQNLAVEVAVAVRDGSELPGEQSFAWQVLTALGGEVTAGTAGGMATIRMIKQRESPA